MNATTGPPADDDGPQPPPRVVIEDLRPRVDGGRFPARRVSGEVVEVAAAIFTDGHDHLHCRVRHRPASREEWTQVVMSPGVDDEWRARFRVEELGPHHFEVVAWVDELATAVSGVHRKLEVDAPVDSDLAVIAELLDDAARRGASDGAARLHGVAADLRAGRIEGLLAGEEAVMAAVHETLPLATAVSSTTAEITVERPLAARGAWYELFPRSWPAEPGRAGTLRDLVEHLPYVADMGFDVLYLPPIHPIGTTHRKGADNSPTARPGEPGSPWAIGGPEGGHTAVHPALGDLEDLDALVAAAAATGLEVALDLAFQCSPDHPWVVEHPEWFRHRPDGTIQYAENPPKRYQDIYPLDFGSTDWQNLWRALADVVHFWIGHGIRTFRVDNPHTKPFAFWEWLIADVRGQHPDVVFLSEAFTRPRVMHRLAKAGFSQSYTYFTWRVSGGELRDYFGELAHGPGAEYFRPNAWPNTPDILPYHLQGAPPAAFASRLVLAATLSPSYGIYGPAFELGEHEPLAAGTEEYLHAEKYEVRTWDLDDPASLRPLVTAINRIRRDQPALGELRSLAFHHCDNDQLLCYSKRPDLDDPDAGPVLVVVNLDPHWAQSGWVHLDLPALGLGDAASIELDDLLGGHTFRWDGPDNFVQLDPASQPAHVFAVRAAQ